MAHHVPLPPPVESLIHLICTEHSQPQPAAPARRELDSLGEEDSLRLLNRIRSTGISVSFDSSIKYLAKQYRSPVSTANFASPEPAGVVLPSSVEGLISRICEEQSQPPLGISPKRKLALLGEQESLRVLETIRRSKISKSFDGFVNHMVRSGSPSAASTTAFSSPSSSWAVMPVKSLSATFCALDEEFSSVQERARLSTAANVEAPNRQTAPPSSDAAMANGQSSLLSTDLHKPNASTLSPCVKVRTSNGQTSGTLLQALHELEFRKAFLILSYIGRNKLQDVTTIDEIRSLAAVQHMVAFENELWNRLGCRFSYEKDRVKHLDWESGGRYCYHCYVYSDGSYIFKGPYLSRMATLLQKVLGDENVLIVKYCDPEGSGKSTGPSTSCTGFKKIAEEGIFVGMKRFRFFVFKDGGKEEKKKSGSGAVKSYYVNVDSFARFYENRMSSSDVISVCEGRRIFMHVDNLSSLSAYMARLSLILSKTITLEVNLDDPDVHVEVIDDIPCEDDYGLYTQDKDGKLQIHTDGTGFISEELALRCPRNCYQGCSSNDQFLERYNEIVRLGSASIGQFKPDFLQPPLLTQFRMFHKGRAVKGTVLVNKKLGGKKIQIRPSMIKVETDPELSSTPAVNSFEIVSTSNRPRKPRLSRYLIALLYYGGVPRDFFMNILVNEILDAKNSLSSKRAALKVAVLHGDMDDNFTVARMILSGIPLDEPYIQWRLHILGKEEKKSLKEGRLPVDDSFYVMGTADPTGSLNGDEVCIIHETGQIVGDVLVYRHPGVHFGDIHILKATYVRGLEDFVGNSKYGIFFPTKGPRSLADKMAGGDFDGDMYWVSKHPTLVKAFKQSAPWTPSASSQPSRVNKKPRDLSAEQLEHELIELFLNTRFRPSVSMAQAAQSWLCHMDQLLCLGDERVDEKRQLKEKLCRLVNLYYEALDAPKKGNKVVVPPDLVPRSYPHYMGRSERCSYKSRSLLGEIFDKVDELELETPSAQVWKLPCLDIEVPHRCILAWNDHYSSYRHQMVCALSGGEQKSNAVGNLIQKYKQILYGADEFDKSTRAWGDVREEALAIYHVTYDFAFERRKTSYCGFAWNVAGPALFKIFMEDRHEKPISCLPSVLREIL